jgi:hypothetical protein
VQVQRETKVKAKKEVAARAELEKAEGSKKCSQTKELRSQRQLGHT